MDKINETELIKSKGSVFKHCLKINELSENEIILPTESTSLKSGGYF